MTLSILSGDGTRRLTNKSKLKKVLLVGVGNLNKAVLAAFPKDFVLIEFTDRY